MTFLIGIKKERCRETFHVYERLRSLNLIHTTFHSNRYQHQQPVLIFCLVGMTWTGPFCPSWNGPSPACLSSSLDWPHLSLFELFPVPSVFFAIWTGPI